MLTWRKVAGILLAGALLTGVASCSSIKPAVATPQATTSNERRELFVRGAKLWPVKCSQCHNARPGGEYSPAQWQQILMHMRTLANLPGGDARAMLVYLQAGR